MELRPAQLSRSEATCFHSECTPSRAFQAGYCMIRRMLCSYCMSKEMRDVLKGLVPGSQSVSDSAASCR